MGFLHSPHLTRAQPAKVPSHWMPIFPQSTVRPSAKLLLRCSLCRAADEALQPVCARVQKCRRSGPHVPRRHRVGLCSTLTLRPAALLPPPSPASTPSSTSSLPMRAVAAVPPMRRSADAHNSRNVPLECPARRTTEVCMLWGEASGELSTGGRGRRVCGGRSG